MKYLTSLVCAFALCTAVHAAPPSPESVERLLAASGAEKLVNSMQQQLDGMMKAGMDQALKGQDVPPEARQLADNMRQKMVADMKDELSWASMKDLYIQVYSESFTQEDIDGLTAFYESPAGKSFVSKMPTVMQKTIALMQQRMGPIMQKMQKSMHEAVTEAQAQAKAAKAANAAPAPAVTPAAPSAQ